MDDNNNTNNSFSIHELAVQIADQLNRSTINENLAKQVVNLAKSNSSEEKFINACKIFGNFNNEFLHTLYQSRAKLGDGNSTEPVNTLQRKADIKKDDKNNEVAHKKKTKVEFRKRKFIKQEDEDVDNDDDRNALSYTARQKLKEIRDKRQDRPYDDPPDRYLKKQRPYSPSPKVKKEEPEEEKVDPETLYEKESLEALDRDWYNADEFGHVAGEDSHNPFYDSYWIEPEVEKQLENKMQKRMSARAAERQRDSDMWEKNRMRTSGIVGQGEIDMDHINDEDHENRVHLFVHNLTPPFLDGKQIFSRQRDPVSAVKDPQSDLAVASRRGSALVKERRQQRERQKQSRAAASMAGTTLGNVMGIKDEDEEDNGQVDNNWGSKFSDQFNQEKEEEAEKKSSQFSTKTLREQRQFLPAFAVRQELLKVIRDNQGKVARNKHYIKI